MNTNFVKRMLALALAIVMALGMVACGGETAPETTNAPETNAPETNAPETTAPAADETTAPADVWTPSMDTLYEYIADEDAYMVLEGISGGWAPTVMVLLNDGTFYALVDYAGQAVVNFVAGTYEIAEDGTITATGEQYNTGDELVYTITAVDGTYSVEVAIPDTDAVGTLTGTVAE